MYEGKIFHWSTYGTCKVLRILLMEGEKILECVSYRTGEKFYLNDDEI